MKFSLVVTCFNEMKSLPRWHEDLSNQTRKPDEVVVVDSESSDGTTEFLMNWAEKDPTIKVIVRKCSPARGHNIGNEAAQHDYIVSTDMGIRIDPKWFEEIVKPVEEDPEVQVVAGSYMVDMATVTSPAARAEYYIEGNGVPKIEPGFIVSNRSVVYSKKVWSELGGLPEDLTRYADDSVFGRQIVQAGYKMAFAPSALVYWARPQTLKAFWKEKYNYGFGDGEAAIKTPFAFRLYEKGTIPRYLVAPLTAIRFSTTQIRKLRLKEALKKGDLLGLLYVIPLLWGCGWNFGKAYALGDLKGAESCQDCRARLQPN